MTAFGPFIVALLGVVSFSIVLWRTRVIGLMSGLSAKTTAGVSAMFDASLDDAAKEAVVRKSGIQLIAGALQILWRFGLAIAATLAPVYLANWARIVPSERSLDMLLRIDFLLGVSLAAIAAGWLLSRRHAKTKIDATESQWAGDRMVHALAFASPVVMRAVGRLDDTLFARRTVTTESGPPIFVTSLARAGTTAVLSALSRHPQIATHLYRDMPFITAPILWSHLGGSGRSVEKRERAHGDGLTIDLDTPEAFDEVLWMLRWPQKYGSDGIKVWTPADVDAAATSMFMQHFAKIAYLRRRGGKGIRYLSKNNANIARLRVLRQMFPGASVVIPLRHPAPHAASLHRQHINFIQRHAKDPYGRRYMADIGHFEFGALHRPLLFDGMPPFGLEPEDPNYWLHYWVIAFREVAKVAQTTLIVAQDDLRASPKATMEALFAGLGLDPDLKVGCGFLTVPDTRVTTPYSTDLLDEAESLYALLYKTALRA